MPSTSVVYICGHINIERGQDSDDPEWVFIDRPCHDPACRNQGSAHFTRTMTQPPMEQLSRVRDCGRILLLLYFIKIDKIVRGIRRTAQRREALHGVRSEALSDLFIREPANLFGNSNEFFSLPQAARLICMADEFSKTSRTRAFFDFCYQKLDNLMTEVRRRFEALEEAHRFVNTSPDMNVHPSIPFPWFRFLQQANTEVSRARVTPSSLRQFREQDIDLLRDSEGRHLDRLTYRVDPKNQRILEAIVEQVMRRMTIGVQLVTPEGTTVNSVTPALLGRESAFLLYHSTHSLIVEGDLPSDPLLHLLRYFRMRTLELGGPVPWQHAVDIWGSIHNFLGTFGVSDEHPLTEEFLHAIMFAIDRFLDQTQPAPTMWAPLLPQAQAMLIGANLACLEAQWPGLIHAIDIQPSGNNDQPSQ